MPSDSDLLNELNNNDLAAELSRNTRAAARVVNGFPSWAKGFVGIVSIILLRYVWGLLLDGLEWVKTSGVTILTSVSKVGLFLTLVGLGKYYLLPAYEKYQKVSKKLKDASKDEQKDLEEYGNLTADLLRAKDECTTARGLTRQARETMLRLGREVKAEEAKMGDILLRLELLQNDIRTYRHKMNETEVAARHAPADKKDEFEMKIELYTNDENAAKGEARPLEEKVANFRSLQKSEEDSRLRLSLAQNDETKPNDRKNVLESRVATKRRLLESITRTKNQAKNDSRLAGVALMKTAIIWLVAAYVSWRMA